MSARTFTYATAFVLLLAGSAYLGCCFGQLPKEIW